MARNVIVCKGNREAQQIEGTLDTGNTPLPGTHIQLSSDGKYDVWDGAADGERDEVILLVENLWLGRTTADAYAPGPFFAFAPLPGDECQVLVASGETIAIGGKLIIDKGTGKCIATTGSPEMEPWKALESSGGALGADTLILCRRI